MTWLRRKTYWLCLLGSRAQCWSFGWFYSWFNNNNNPRTLVRQGQFFQDCRTAPVSISLGVQTDRFFVYHSFDRSHWLLNVRLTKFRSGTTLVEVSPSQSFSCLTRNSEEFVEFALSACQDWSLAYVLNE